jgi:hypothetical protein
MIIRFAKSYVDRLFAERDVTGLHHLIGVVSQDRALPEEFWLFCRIIEWIGATRSGVWQYYGSTPANEINGVTQALRRFGLDEIAEKYSAGEQAPTKPDRDESLDHWIDTHEQQIYDTVFNLIATRKDLLAGVASSIAQK